MELKEIMDIMASNNSENNKKAKKSKNNKANKKDSKKEIVLKEENSEIQLKDNESSKKEITVKKNQNQSPTYVFALGGLEEVGKNMYIVEQENEIWIIDSGIKFSSEVFSIEGIIPGFDYLEKNKSKIKGLIITHGHEDHIGAVPHLLNVIDIPKIYSGRMSSNQIWAKIRENKGLKKPKIEIINNTSKIKSRLFSFEFFNVNHSIPDSFGIVVRSNNGIIVSTGDFKFDLSPVGSRADFYRMAEIGQEGVTLLLSDSTNAQVDKWSLSERNVSISIDKIVRERKNRIIVATFASNVYRVREVINIALKYNRKIAIFGWSMEKTIKIARTIKYINVPDDLFVEGKKIKEIDDDKLIILSTGTQGEQMAALSKMANRNHQYVKIKASDTIVFASSAIPGNFLGVEKTINNLVKANAEIITNKTHHGVHASGHGGEQEQLLMLNLIRPKFFFPIHGETMMLQKHAKTAEKIGIKAKNSFVLKNGERLEVLNGHVRKTTSVVARDVFIDGTNLKGQSLKVVTDRKQMSENGFLNVVVAIDSKTNTIIKNPIVTMKGIFEEKQNAKQIKSLEDKVKNELNKYFDHSKKITFSGIKENIRITCENEIFKIIGYNPIVAPTILNVSSKYTPKDEVVEDTKEEVKKDNKKEKQKKNEDK